ncbi:hypothetical protein HU824_17800 [Bacteroides sp. L10-4]|uniref:hypothetical protein n=1 Tax=Bacteroides sp. L10-4 TaxID=2746063 RepID=UPI0015950844|nr:hypothetical protein [Bacteroides sp. L10-4]NVK95000.1 hypothetical protein [Bacteroides sp. L10-4]
MTLQLLCSDAATALQWRCNSFAVALQHLCSNLHPIAVKQTAIRQFLCPHPSVGKQGHGKTGFTEKADEQGD